MNYNKPKISKFKRFFWLFCYNFFYRPTPIFMHSWRCFILKMFGASIGKNVHPYPSARIWAPWNLRMADNSCLAQNVDCYCVDKISIGKNSTISQYSFLCTASHDYNDPAMPLITAPIIIKDNVWITSDVFIAPGVTIADRVVVLARSSVFDNLEYNKVYCGNPAKFLKFRH